MKSSLKQKAACHGQAAWCARGRIRTLNPQSRNLIFYPVELRMQDAWKTLTLPGHKFSIITLLLKRFVLFLLHLLR